MLIIKIFLVPMLSLVILWTPISVIFCSAIEPLTGMEKSSSSYEENYPNHHQTDCHNCPHNKSPCQYDHSCCNLVTLSAIFYLSALDSYPLNPAEILFQPLEVTKFFFHPPRTHI